MCSKSHISDSVIEPSKILLSKFIIIQKKMPSAAACIPRQRHTIKSVQINRSTAPEGIFDNLF